VSCDYSKNKQKNILSFMASASEFYFYLETEVAGQSLVLKIFGWLSAPLFFRGTWL
jgi:hypothetical protein